MSNSKISFNIPERLIGKVKNSNIYQNYTSRGYPSSYGIDLDFEELNLSRTIKSTEISVLRSKVEATLFSWDEKYQRYLNKLHAESRSEHVDDLNREASELLHNLDNILFETLNVDDTVDWDLLRREDQFKIDPTLLFEDGDEPDFIRFGSSGRPISFDTEPDPDKPELSDVRSEYGLFSKLFRAKKIEEDFYSRLESWDAEKKRISRSNAKRKIKFEKANLNFERKKQDFDEEKKKDNETLENIKDRYANKDAKAVEEYCDLVLSSSIYPDFFPSNWSLEYRHESKMLVVSFDLPGPNLLPDVVSYKYIKSRDEITKKVLSKTQKNKLFNDVIYKICIRTIHELFEADVIDAIGSVAFNGEVIHRSKATGNEETKTILSVVAQKEEFMNFDLSRIDPKATFKHLKGVSAANLVDLAPVPPIIHLEKLDKRFIDNRDIVAGLDTSVNLAAMPWDDFEHLVRELFEQEFATSGGEVKVTQASSDGGVDAVAFDPDPIRGGKIVIQAKRYTNVVGLAAVRDLYGTVMNEGATKGILVTTSDYGSDSYGFAKDKPITLLNGSNLLSLLEKHGHKARINVDEAKKLLKRTESKEVNI